MTLHVGICGAGIGGLAAAIAIAQAGAKVTVLEAASELGEIGAGIQMTPNVSRLLIAWGVDKVIGDDLVRHEEYNLRLRDGTKVGFCDPAKMERDLTYPWWVVHRHHLHSGLAEVARRNKVGIKIGARVEQIKYENQIDNSVNVVTQKGDSYHFDFLIGADGLNSVVRKTLFPNVTPRPPNGNCAYRAIVPYDKIREKAHLRPLVEKLTMETWMGPNGYIISYPISNGQHFNMVMSHNRPNPVTGVEDVADLQNTLAVEYADYDPRIREIMSMIEKGSVQRWPLMVTGPLDSWSSPCKNIVLMGDAAHSMVNHMAQGAATSMEDGAFLGVVMEEVVKGRMGLADAVDVYEAGRMPQSRMKQQTSFLNGAIWMLSDEDAQYRDIGLRRELEAGGSVLTRSPNLYSDPVTVREVYGYDVYQHASQVLEEWRRGAKFDKTAHKTLARETCSISGVERWRADRTMNWFLPGIEWSPVRTGMMQVRTGIEDP